MGRLTLRRSVQAAAFAISTIASLAACSEPVPDALQRKTMRASVTWLHLLRHTPFFTELSTPQLQWVIDHSREWEADAGAVIATDASSAAHDNWILLDGGWEIRRQGEAFASGHADAGKWFNAAEAGTAPFELVVTTHSYVMQIKAADMQTMLAEGFAFGPHLAAGHAYYQAMFGSKAAAPTARINTPIAH